LCLLYVKKINKKDVAQNSVRINLGAILFFRMASSNSHSRIGSSATRIGSSICRSRKYARSSAARRRLSSPDISPRPRSRLARLTCEDEVSELCIVGALFRTLALSQRTARSLLYADTATVTIRAASEPFITAPFLSRGCFVMIFVANWYPRTK